jgi:hypothetical protein
MGFICDIFTPRVQLQDKNVFFLAFYVDGRSESWNTFGMMIGNERDPLGELSIIIDFNTNKSSFKDRLLKFKMLLIRLLTNRIAEILNHLKIYWKNSPVYWYSQLLSQHVVLQKWASSQGPLTSLTSSKVKFKCHSSHQQTFDKIKKFIGTEVIICYPDFNKPVLFHLYTDA